MNIEDETGVLNVGLLAGVGSPELEDYQYWLGFPRPSGRLEKADGVINLLADGFAALTSSVRPATRLAVRRMEASRDMTSD